MQPSCGGANLAVWRFQKFPPFLLFSVALSVIAKTHSSAVFEFRRFSKATLRRRSLNQTDLSVGIVNNRE
jgi:hypothetical protein